MEKTGQFYKGACLPDGMTPELAERLEAIIFAGMEALHNDYGDGQPEPEEPFRIGIRCFREMREILASGLHD